MLVPIGLDMPIRVSRLTDRSMAELPLNPP
jgi:hypothetical protein